MHFKFIPAAAFAACCLLTSAAGAQLVNIAQGRPATASGSYGGNGYTIESGNDGNPATWWNGGTHAAWWQVDLESMAAIDMLTVSAGDGPGYHITFEISASDDGLNWHDVVGATGSGNPWDFSFETPGLQARFLRYTTLGDGGSDWASLGELAAFGTFQSNGVPEPSVLLLALAALPAAWGARSKRTTHQS